LEYMEVAWPVFRRFVELVTLSTIYGEPSERVLKQSHEKARGTIAGGTAM
jgi:hypothetical protein